MARFFGGVVGDRGESTRTGSKSSGIMGHVWGWTLGARVSMSANKGNDKDNLCVELTHGGHGNARRGLTIYATELDNGKVQLSIWREGVKEQRVKID